MQRRKWKKLIAVIVILSLEAFSMSGCGEENNQEEGNVESKTQNNIETVTEEKNNENSRHNDNSSTGFFTEYTVEDAKDGYFVVSKLDGDLFGMLDSYGNEILPLEYDHIIFPNSKESQAVIVEKEGKFGILDYSGKVILPIEYNSIDDPEVNGTLYLVEKEGVQSIVKLDGAIYKELAGKYDDLLADCFLVKLRSETMEAYGLDEQVLLTAKNEPGGAYFYDWDTVNGYLGICDIGSSTMDIMDLEGKVTMTFPFAQEGQTYGMISDIGLGNLVRIEYSSNGDPLNNCHYKLINIAQGSVTDKDYNQITGNEEAVFALYINHDTDTSIVDIYDLEGKIMKSVEFDSNSVITEVGNPLIKVEYGNTCRLYDSAGEDVSGERYLNAEPVHNFWIVQNLEGEYGLMDPEGQMRINFGEIGDESYQGKEWEDTYVFEDTFCIVTESNNECNVWLF